MGFLAGALQGYTGAASNLKKGGQKGLLFRRKKKATDLSGGGKSIPDFTQGTTVPSYKKGGRVKKTGLARLHRGERVLNRKQAKKYAKRKGRSKSR